MKIPLSNGTLWDIDPFLDGFKARHPHIQDWNAELAKMHLWLSRNPSRQPVSPFRFVDHWMRKIKVVAKPKLAGGMTDSEIEAMGRAKGIQARPGESYSQYLRRIRTA